jgi:quinol monooxygenase YgiN
MAIIIAGSIKVPADKREYLLTSSREHILASRAEPGCEYYDWAADLAEPEKIQVFELWTDEVSLAEHFAGQPYIRTVQLIADTCEVVEADISKYRVDLREPVYDPEGKPRADFFTG